VHKTEPIAGKLCLPETLYSTVYVMTHDRESNCLMLGAFAKRIKRIIE
jgi:hypothetical protein